MQLRTTIALVAAAGLVTACDESRTLDDPAGGVVQWPTPAPSPPADDPEDPENPDDVPDDATESCSPAPQAFAYSLCSCEGLRGLGNLAVYGGDAATAFVGVNGQSTIEGSTLIEGSAVFYGGLRSDANLEVSGHVATAASFATAGAVSVGGNLDVGGDLTGVGLLDVGGVLRVEGQESVSGPIQAEARGPYQAPPLPCGCDTVLVDVAAEVELARTTNHNAAIGLPTTIDALGNQTFTLPAGRYYLAASRALGNTSFVIEGSVSLYVDGSLDLVGNADIELAQDAMLDLYVSGSVSSIGNFEIGDYERASDLRIFVGGQDAIGLAAGNQAFFGSIYAPQAMFRAVGNTEIVGAVFVRGFEGEGNISLEYAAAGDFPQQECPPDFEDCIRDPDLGGCDQTNTIPAP